MFRGLSIAPRIQIILLYRSEAARDNAFIAFNDLGLYFRTQKTGDDGIRIFHAESICLVLSLFEHDWSEGLVSIVI